MISGSSIEARLAKLERENRLLKRCGAVAVLVGAALLVTAQAPARPRTLEAEKLIIRYQNGKEAIVLEAPSGAGAGAYFSYPNGTQGIALEASPNAGFGAGAYFHPANGKGGAWITAFERETAFHVTSPQDALRIEMSAKEDEAGFEASATKSVASFYHLSLTSLGDVSQALYGKDGKVVWKAP